MNREKAAENWQAARKALQLARTLLGSNPTLEDAQGRQLGSPEQLDEFLAHSELELAVGELESLGELNEVPRAYWQHLREAALRLDLSERAACYAARVDPS